MKNKIFLFIFALSILGASAPSLSAADVGNSNEICEQKAAKEYVGKNTSYISTRKSAFMTVCACKEEVKDKYQSESMAEIWDGSAQYYSCVKDAVGKTAQKCFSEDPEKLARFTQQFAKFEDANSDLQDTLHCAGPACYSLDKVLANDAKSGYLVDILYALNANLCN